MLEEVVVVVARELAYLPHLRGQLLGEKAEPVEVVVTFMWTGMLLVLVLFGQTLLFRHL